LTEGNKPPLFREDAALGIVAARAQIQPLEIDNLVIKHGLPTTSPAWLALLAERQNQIGLGRDPAHDDSHERGELIWMPWGALNRLVRATQIRRDGPLSEYRRRLVQAGALILAELERLDRAAQNRL